MNFFGLNNDRRRLMLSHSEQKFFRAVRRDFHAHPELKFEEHRTSEKIYSFLKEWGCDEITRGLGGTGIVGTIHGILDKNSSKSIGIRADMDALPLMERNQFEHASKYSGKMHACGHDGHLAILLAAGKKLAEERNFSGTLHLIFQPGEEGGAGGKAMIDDGLFEKHPCSEIYALHNWPGLPEGTFGFKSSGLMASSNQFDITITGKGGHAAMPQLCVDPIFIGSQVCQAIYGITSRMVKPIDPAVISISQIKAGDSPNIIGNTLFLSGTVRTFSYEALDLIEKKIEDLSRQICAAYEAKADVCFLRQYPPTINDKKITEYAVAVAEKLFGEKKIVMDVEPTMGAEDFSFMLQQVPGTYFFLGNGDISGTHRGEGHGLGPCTLHNATYDFNDNLIQIGAKFWKELVKSRLSHE